MTVYNLVYSPCVNGMHEHVFIGMDTCSYAMRHTIVYTTQSCMLVYHFIPAHIYVFGSTHIPTCIKDTPLCIFRKIRK